MKEKTKTILSHIACALGGMALGIALLGGLSYCSTANKAKTESVNTILTTKKNAVITTDGGYTGYTFEIDSDNQSVQKAYSYEIYSLDPQTYTPTLIESQSGTLSENSRNGFLSLVDTAYSAGKAYASTDTYRLNRIFLKISSYSSPWNATAYYFNILYLTFIEPDYTSVTDGITNSQEVFILNGIPSMNAISLVGNRYTQYGTNNGTQYFLNNQKNDSYIYSSQSFPETLVFQDVKSYYKETGYQDGYHSGETTGYNSGYNEGLTDGLEYGQEFTTYQVMTQDNNGGTRWPSYGWTINNNAPSGMYGSFSSSTYQIANLMQYKTQDDDLHLIYLMLPIEQSGDLFGHVYIYVYNLTDSVLEDNGLAYGIRYYQSTADEKGWDYAYIFWTSGGTRTLEYGKVTGIYNDSLQKGYIQLSGLVYQETIYNTGYQAGLLAGQTSSNMNNVFSLFTTAFNAVGGFFELQVFGFLPLYWFFLAPLFVALIALILRMVKH